MNEMDFDTFLKSILIPDFENFDELTRAISKYNSETGLAAAICAVVHTWCDDHNVDPITFFNMMSSAVSKEVAEEEENGLL
jgi:hypothetical protein